MTATSYAKSESRSDSILAPTAHLTHSTHAQFERTKLSISKLDVSIGQKKVLSDINVQFKPGAVTALLGPNGAGKSTLLKALCQEISTPRQSIRLGHSQLVDWPRRELAKSLAVLPQHASLTFPFTVFEVVAMGLYPLTISHKEGEALVAEQLAQVGLTHLAKRSYPTLSGGEKQRVQLARVLTQLSQSPFPPILLLDEPTSALDLAQQHRVLELAQHLAHQQAYTVIVVLHDLNQAARYSDQLIVLKQGRIVSEGAPAEALSVNTIREVWDYEPVYLAAPEGGHPLIF
ncbi:heme ABC transporter ATP-binding protein [Shewanella sp. SP2S2-4]|uniref:heme ABC transporter ATP-binding protein n=1 Tax=Shewanella sp. SP2S2-4 TaxID=3063539 RepID=UPI00289192FD|nr:heme ABC transporter ATP-binding protein [Shewanella sp. SP2S2-4]MDT3275205.1 heme ABC transporter ATP-binding protein [Shewanella sp. SP2S2-4]